MAYTAHTWETGEPITAPLMNALERAVEGMSGTVEDASTHAVNLHTAIAGENGALPSTPLTSSLGVLEERVRQISAETDQIAALRNSIDTVQGEVIAARGTNPTTGETNQVLASHFTQLETRDTELQRSLELVDLKAIYAKTSIENAKAPYETLQEKIIAMDDLDTTLAGLINELTIDINNSSAVYNKTTLRETITKIRDDIADTNTRIGADEDTISQNQAAITALQTRIGYGSEEARSIKTIISELESTLRTNTTNKANEAKTEAKQYADGLVTPIANEINGAHRANVTNDTLDNRFDDIESRLDTVEPLVSTAGTNISSLQTRMGTAETNISALQTEMNGSHRQGVANDTLGAHLSAIDSSITQLLNKSSTEVKSLEWFNTDPQPTGDPKVDYIIGPDTNGKYFYYKYIVDGAENNWKLISGGGGAGNSSALMFNSYAEFENATLNNKDENTDYYVKDSNNYYVHYRFNKTENNGVVTYTPVEIKQDAYSTAQTYSRLEVYNKNEVDEAISDAIDGIEKDQFTLSYGTMSYPYGQDGAVETENVLTLFQNEDVAGQVIITGGGGGGGQTTGYAVTFNRITDNPVVVTGTDNVIIQFNYLCVDDENQAVSGMFSVKKGNTTIIPSRPLSQGINTIDLTEYCTTGTQRFYISLSTEGGVAVPAKYWDVQVVDVRLESNFNDNTVFSTNDYVNFTYTPYGAKVEKTVHFILDGVELEPAIVSSSGSLMSLSIPPQAHGAHLLETYITATVNDKSIETPHIYKDIIWAQPGSRVPIIGCIYRYDHYGELDIKQYNNFSIPYYVYDPRSSTPTIMLSENGATVNTLKVSANQNTWSYKSINPTVENVPNILVITCGVTTVELHVNVKSLDYQIVPITANLAFDFNPMGYSNNDTAHRLWNYTANNNTINLSVSNNFDWNNGGYKLDSDGSPYFCVKSGTRAYINYKLFGRNPKTTGAEFKVIFKTMNVRNVQASFLRCLSPNYSSVASPTQAMLDNNLLFELINNEYVHTQDITIDGNKTYYADTDSAGIEMKAHETRINSGAAELTTTYSEEDIIEFEYNINTIDTTLDGAESYIMTYEDGVSARPLIYNAEATLYQTTDPADIEIGSDDCDIWIYRMKAYTSALSDSDILSNFCADARDAEEMVNRYERNLIYDENNNLTPQSVAEACPDLKVICIEAPFFTNDKNDYVKNTKVTCIHTNGRPRDNWTWTNGYHVGQGTSSNLYGQAGRNIDIIFGFDGTHTVVSKIKENDVQGYVSQVEFKDGTVLTGANAKVNLSDTSIENTWFNIKVNIASSENTNNALLQKRYDRFLPYETPAMKRDSRVKNDMEFFNCVIFIKETDDTYDTTKNIYTAHREFPNDCEWHFYGIGNVGDSKKTDNTRVNDPTDMKEFCIEVSDNNLPNSMFQTGVYKLDDNSLTYDATGMDDAEKMARMVYPITEDQWTNANNIAHKSIDLTGYVSGQKWDDKKQAWVDVITNWDSSFEFRYDMGTKDGESYEDAELEAQQEESKLVWNNFYKWVITSSDSDFRSHLSDWTIQPSVLYWYLFTERYIMIDSRAKNTFWHYGKVYISDNEYNGTTLANLQAAYDSASAADKPAIHKQIIHAQSVYDNRAYYTRDNAAAAIRDGYRFELWDYDNDTALGIDNSGRMTIPYGKEDTDKDNKGAYYFNAAENIFWRRVSENMTSELTTLYTNTNLTQCWSANNLIMEFDNWQNQFPEELWRLDVERKYLRPYHTGAWSQTEQKYIINKTFLEGMANGRKKYQRRQFERDQEIYVATKYLQSAAREDTVTLRLATADANSVKVVPVRDEIKITPYSDMYIRVMFGNANTVVSRRAKAGVEYTVTSPVAITSRNTLQVAIYAASRIQAFNDLSSLYVDDNDFSRAIKLKTLVLGNPTPGYNNPALTSVGIGANTLLETLDLRNLQNLTGSINLARCDNLINLYANNTSITSVTFATGGKITNAYLPSTLSSLTCRNLSMLTNLNIAGYSQLSQFTCINSNIINPLTIVQAAINTLQIINITGLQWTLPTTQLLNQIYEKSSSLLAGTATVEGQVHRSELNHYNEKWGEDFTVIYDPGSFIEQYRFRFVMYDDNTQSIIKDLYECYKEVNETLMDPVYAGDMPIPTKASTYAEDYTFGILDNGTYRRNSGWKSITGEDFQTIQVNSSTGNRTYKAIFYATPHKYTVTWYLDNMGQNEFCHDSDVAYNSEAVPPLGIPASTFDNSDNTARVFVGWDKSTAAITENTNVFAVWEEDTLPSAQTVAANGLNGLNVAQLYALGETTINNRVEILGNNYIKDYIDVTLGEDYNFNNVPSQTLINSNYKLDGSVDNIKFYDGQSHFGSAAQPVIKPLSNTNGFTLAIDFKFSQAIANEVLVGCFSTAGASNAKGFKLMLSSISSGTDLQPCICWGEHNTKQQVGYYDVDNNKHYRNIVVIRRPANSNNLYVYYSNTSDQFSDDVQVRTLTANDTILDMPLILGSYGYYDNNTNSYILPPDGTDDFSVPGRGIIYWSKIWNGDLGDTACRKLAAWPHETVRFELQGYDDIKNGVAPYKVYYNKTDSSSTSDLTVGLTFNSISLIGDRTYYNAPNMLSTNNTSTTGWYESPIRNFCNTRLYNAFPQKWRSILGSAPIRSYGKSYNGSYYETNTEQGQAATGDYVTIPTYFEFNGEGSDSTPFTEEGIWNHIPWLVSTSGGSGRAFATYNENGLVQNNVYSADYNRIKFNGLYPPAGAKIYTNTVNNNPANRTGSNVKSGDIWIPTGNGSTGYAYIYVSAADLATDTYTLQTGNFNCNSGGWVASDAYWTRSLLQSGSWINYYLVGPLGNSNLQFYQGSYQSGVSYRDAFGLNIQISI